MTNPMSKKILLTVISLFFASCAIQASHTPEKKREPAFEWRGCMFDLSRHFFTIDFIERQIDVLSGMGINVLHLHLTDAGGWRLRPTQNSPARLPGAQKATGRNGGEAGW